MKKTTVAMVPLVFFTLLISVSALMTQEKGDGPRQETILAPSTPVVISDSINISTQPLIGLDSTGANYVVWIDTGNFRTLRFTTNKSGSWVTPSSVEKILDPGDMAGFPAFTVTPAGACHLTFQDDGPTSLDVFYLAYDGTVWSKLINICFNIGPSGLSSSDINPIDNTLFVVWIDGTVNTYEIYLKYRTSAGAWSLIQTVPVGLGYAPDISLDAKGTAHLVWAVMSGGDSAVLYSKNPSPQDPTQWTKPITIKGATAESNSRPKVRSDKAGNAYVIWRDGTQGNDEIFFREVLSDTTLSDEVNISMSTYSAQDGAIAVNKDNGQVYVAWSEGEHGVFFNARADTWFGPNLLSGGLGSAYSPSLSVDAAGAAHVVYSAQTGRTVEIVYQTVGTGTGPTTTSTTTTTIPVDPMPPADLVLVTQLDEFPNKKINTLSWHRNLLNKDIPLDGYRIYRKRAGLTDAAYGFLAAVPADFFQYADKDLSFSQSYTYAVSALARSGKESGQSAAVTENSVFPPRNVQVRTIFNRSLALIEKINILTWLETPLNQAVSVSAYNVYRRSINDDSSVVELIATVGANATTFSDRRVPRDERFSYAVTAVDGAGRESARSESAYEEF